MAKLQINTGRRGRPSSIDAEAELLDLYQSYLPKVQQRLKIIRETTHGTRDAEYLGSETELPDFIQSTINALVDIAENQTIDYEDYKEIKANLNTIRQLASRQQRVYGRALAASLTSEYERTLDYFGRNASEFTREYNTKLLNAVKQFTPQERQSFFLSDRYQDPATMTGEYSNVLAWATSEVRREAGDKTKVLSMQEAWAYLRYRRMLDGKLGV